MAGGSVAPAPAAMTWATFVQPLAMGVLLGQGLHVCNEVLARGSLTGLGLCVTGMLLGLLLGIFLCCRSGSGRAELRLSLFWMSCALNGGLAAIAQLRLQLGQLHAKDESLVINLFLSSVLLGTSLPQMAHKIIGQPDAEVLMPCVLALLFSEAAAGTRAAPVVQVGVSVLLLASGLRGIMLAPRSSKEIQQKGAFETSSASTNGTKQRRGGSAASAKEPLTPFLPPTVLESQQYSPHFLVKCFVSAANGADAAPMISLVDRLDGASQPPQQPRKGRDRGGARDRDDRQSRTREDRVRAGKADARSAGARPLPEVTATKTAQSDSTTPREVKATGKPAPTALQQSEEEVDNATQEVSSAKIPTDAKAAEPPKESKEEPMATKESAEEPPMEEHQANEEEIDSADVEEADLEKEDGGQGGTEEKCDAREEAEVEDHDEGDKASSEEEECRPDKEAEADEEAEEEQEKEEDSDDGKDRQEIEEDRSNECVTRTLELTSYKDGCGFAMSGVADDLDIDSAEDMMCEPRFSQRRPLHAIGRSEATIPRPSCEDEEPIPLVQHGPSSLSADAAEFVPGPMEHTMEQTMEHAMEHAMEHTMEQCHPDAVIGVSGHESQQWQQLCYGMDYSADPGLMEDGCNGWHDQAEALLPMQGDDEAACVDPSYAAPLDNQDWQWSTYGFGMEAGSSGLNAEVVADPLYDEATAHHQMDMEMDMVTNNQFFGHASLSPEAAEFVPSFLPQGGVDGAQRGQGSSFEEHAVAHHEHAPPASLPEEAIMPLLDPEAPEPGSGRASAVRSNAAGKGGRGRGHDSSHARPASGGSRGPLWAYIDPQDRIQTGFTSEDMKQWYDVGYFDKDLLVALAPGRRPPQRRDFYKLKQWFPNAAKAFTYVPKF